ncbi:hypothetical protein KIN20_028637 [Parelaphostrongylus tenuis]|uniref:Uncharacterized protein n=1 Tax=Parelaphostrongylus tenuis TaxID=148309 RepID=A0AAD5R152_PARTN|nr:hypothetical protein KIN20_028637 [Parelaphostrongylus tenuis]
MVSNLWRSSWGLLSAERFIVHLYFELKDARRENAELRKQLVECGSGEHGQLIRAFEAERRQHIELLMQLKYCSLSLIHFVHDIHITKLSLWQEALLAAIAEKDRHLTLLGKLRTSREEIDTVRRKLKQENGRIVSIFSQVKLYLNGVWLLRFIVINPLWTKSTKDGALALSLFPWDTDFHWTFTSHSIAKKGDINIGLGLWVGLFSALQHG